MSGGGGKCGGVGSDFGSVGVGVGVGIGGGDCGDDDAWWRV